MIYEPIEVFNTQAGLIPSLDTHNDGKSEYVLLNFDDAENPENNGGYIRMRLENGFVYIEAFTADGEVIMEKTIHCNEFKPMGDNNG
jgi:hypothetical protein